MPDMCHLTERHTTAIQPYTFAEFPNSSDGISSRLCVETVFCTRQSFHRGLDEFIHRSDDTGADSSLYCLFLIRCQCDRHN